MSFDGTEMTFLVSTSSTCVTSMYGHSRMPGTGGTGIQQISYHIVNLHIDGLKVSCITSLNNFVIFSF